MRMQIIFQEDFFVIDAFAGAMAKDQRATSHPLFVPIEKSNEINEVFDSISYDKVRKFFKLYRECLIYF